MINKTRMLMEDILLDEKGVDSVSALLQKWMSEKKVQPKNALRCRLAWEELLERICVHYDRRKRVDVAVRRRFGASEITVLYDGEAYNPAETDETDTWTRQLLGSVGLVPAWNYRQGVNMLTLRLPRNKLRSEIIILAAVAAAVILGLSKSVMPAAVTSALDTYVFSSVSTIFTDLLGAFAGLMVFLMVLAGICGVGNVSEFSRLGGYLIGRNVLNSFIGSAVAAAAFIPFFELRRGASAERSQGKAILDMILQIIPKDPVSPFVSGNTLQIAFMAIIIGMVLVMLGPAAKGLREMAIQANTAALRIIEIVCRLLPLYILSSLTMLFWENGMEVFSSIWKPIVCCTVICFGLMAVKILAVTFRCGANPLLLFKKTLPGFLIGLATCSSMAALGTVMDENEKKLGIDSRLSNFGLPIEMIICNSTVSGGFLAILYYLAEFDGVQVGPGWFISSWFVVTLLCFSMPPVSCGALVCLTVMLAQAGISPACLGLAGTLAIITDFPMTASRIVISQMELALEAKHWNTLDTEKLRA